jgi:hypothetical protein
MVQRNTIKIDLEKKVLISANKNDNGKTKSGQQMMEVLEGQVGD